MNIQNFNKIYFDEKEQPLRLIAFLENIAFKKAASRTTYDATIY